MQNNILSRTTFSKIVSNSFSTINKNSVIETEIRFKSFTYNHNSEGFSDNVFDRVLQKFRSEKSSDYRSVESDIEIDGDIRKEKTDNIEWVRKKSLWYEINKEFGMKYTVNTEEKVVEPQEFKPTLFRSRKRYSFIISQGKFRVDLTKIKSYEKEDSKKINPKTSNEIELEILNIRNIRYEELFEVINRMLKTINNTPEIYTIGEKEDIINFYNKTLLSKETKPKLDHKVVTNARNIKYKDLVFGGLIGNPKTTYTITLKADGDRYQMVFKDTGLWLVSSPEEVILLSRREMTNLHGMILDGELIPLSKRRNKNAVKSRYWYLIFDCMSAPGKSFNTGETYVQDLSHSTRMSFSQSGARYIKSQEIPDELLTVNTKTFKIILSSEDFYNKLNEMIRIESLASYQTDGFMFTPEHIPYLIKNESTPPYLRNLTVLPDICKLKPEITIDFFIVKHGITKGIYSYDNNKMVLFEGTDKFPINYKKDFDWKHPLMEKILDEAVVEFRWTKKSKIFTPIRIRNDKLHPNNIYIAKENLNDIHTGVKIDELINDDTPVLMRKYHNVIKTELYEKAFQIVAGRIGKKKLSLLDLGSGIGGDIHKWKQHFDKIVAVEPDIDKMEEFDRRADEDKISKNIFRVGVGSEDHEAIKLACEKHFKDKNGKADVISAMFSLSFLWKNKELIEKLAKTISENLAPHGVFIFITINGDLIQEMLAPSFGNGFQLKGKIKLGAVNFNFSDDITNNEYEINFPNSIIGDSQTEYKVFLDDLTTLLSPKMYLKKYEIANKEQFMSLGEKSYNKLITYGYYDHNEYLEKDFGLIKIV